LRHETYTKVELKIIHLGSTEINPEYS